MSKNLSHEEKPRKIILRDGKTYNLVPLDMNLMVEIEDHFDKALGPLFRDGAVKPLRYAFWVLLKESYPEITEAEVGRLITSRVLGEVQKFFVEDLGMELEES